MSGTTIIGTLIRADAAILEKVAVASIKSGALPEDVTLPALLITSTSLTERQSLVRGETTPQSERVSVKVRAASYADQKLMMKLVVDCCAGKTGTIADFDNVSILTAGRGPDMRGPANTFDQTQDFRVHYHA